MYYVPGLTQAIAPHPALIPPANPESNMCLLIVFVSSVHTSLGARRGFPHPIQANPKKHLCGHHILTEPFDVFAVKLRDSSRADIELSTSLSYDKILTN